MRGKETMWRLTCVVALMGVWAGVAQAEVFTVAVIPDTQNYTWSTRSHGMEMLSREIQFIAGNASKHNIVFVTHLGDVWEHGDLDLSEPLVADRAMHILAGSGIPFCIVPGNHDYDNAACRSRGEPLDGHVVWSQMFGPDSPFFAGKAWYGGSADGGADSYQVFSAGGYQFLHIGLALEPSRADVEFARRVIAEHRGMPTIVTTHEYLGWNTGRDGQARRSDDRYRNGLDSYSSQELWSQFVSQEPQIFMVLCGHSFHGPNHVANRRMDTNATGQAVYQLLSDYQVSGNPGWGGGWIRLMEFDTRQHTIHVRTYSTELGLYSSDPMLTDGSPHARALAPFNYGPDRNLLPAESVFSSDFVIPFDPDGRSKAASAGSAIHTNAKSRMKELRSARWAVALLPGGFGACILAAGAYLSRFSPMGRPKKPG